jgi:hypothetical protein
MPHDLKRVGLQIKQASGALNDLHQAIVFRQPNSHREPATVGLVTDLDRANQTLDFNGTRIGTVFDALDAGSGSLTEETNQACPIEGLAVWQVDDDRIAALTQERGSVKPANDSSRVPESGLNGVIEVPDACETRAGRDFPDRHRRMGDQIPGQLEALGARNLQRRRSQMLLEKASQVP